MMFIEKVGVVGAGTMGAAIAEVMALNGHEVVLKDVKEEYVKQGMSRIRSILDELVDYHANKADNAIEKVESDYGISLTDEQKEHIRAAKSPTYDKERADQVFDRIHPTTSYEDFEDVDLVIEAVVEDLNIKQQVFGDLEKHTERHVPLATNTSVLSISQIAAGTEDRRQKVLGMHFFNPPYQMPLVEVVPGLETHQSVTEGVVSFLEEKRNHRYPMRPVVVKESPGFVVNRILGRAMAEAFLIYEEEVASPRAIDQAVREGLGWPMGPLELADMVGIDVINHVMEGLDEMGATGHQREPQIIKKLVALGRLGKKSGRGFYDYTQEAY
ncbi:MAG: 3-hydroxyacyl-CoA dehydrogenase family protein [Candidatus Thermoplasmatota archaeon]|nr:3-hydroxyacyl-CoA dehydrogenase family protein [Candidatus Thermoplasmatota archaeon]